MAKRLSAKQKEEIIKGFVSGKNISELSVLFNCTKLTISRNLKKEMGEKKYEKLIEQNKQSNRSSKNKKQNIDSVNQKEIIDSLNLGNINSEKKQINYSEENNTLNSFIEIMPLDCEIENSPQKDLTSVPITEVDFPNVVYMIVDKKIELETKYLKDYPEWNFLSQDELNRKTIEIYNDHKIAKRFCKKDQKVIKVPNTNVFKTVAPILISRGISRIVSPEKLIAL